MKLCHSLLAVLFLLTACSGDKYPYPPQFVGPDVLPTAVLGAPPAKGSAEFEREVKWIAARQATLTEKQKETIRSEDKIAPEMMVLPTLGARYTPEQYPALYALLKQAASDAWRIGDVNQDYWQSPRPWVADERVELIAPKITRFGYPSGHTTTNRVWAHVLSELFPAKRDAFFARADSIALHRIEGGVHFPHDVDGGKRLAKLIFKQMRATPEFKRALEAVKEELKNPPVQVILPEKLVSACAMAGC